MDKKLKNELIGKALRYYYTEIMTKDLGDTVTAKQFAEVAFSVSNSIDVDDIVANYIITDHICER